MATTTITQQAQPQQGGAMATGALVGIRLAQALGWRVGAGVLAFTACPMAGAGYFFVSFVDKCFEITKPGRAGSYTTCTNYSGEHVVGWLAVSFAVLCLVAAVGLWRRGGAVRDVELLEERVEGVKA